jgi:hypothetical protein
MICGAVPPWNPCSSFFSKIKEMEENMMLLYAVIAVIAFARVGFSQAVATPASINFGDVLVGQTSPQARVKLQNNGDEALTVTVSVTGPFAIPVNKCGNGVRPHTHCNVWVTYTPAALGSSTGTLAFSDNAPNSPQTVSLTGTGAATAPTKTTITGSAGSVLVGDPVTFTANVVSLGGGTIPDGDTVDFYDKTSKYGSVGIGGALTQNGMAVLQTTGPFWAGGMERDGNGKGENNAIFATYAGDPQFSPSSSRDWQLFVEPWGTTTTLSSSPNPSHVGEAVTFTASVTSSGPIPIGGEVQFVICPDGAENCARVVSGVVSGIATVTYTYKAKRDEGNRPVTAYYKGDPNYNASSAQMVQTVEQ